MRAKCDTTTSEAPMGGASIRSLCANIIWAFQKSADIYHVTGDIHYIVVALLFRNTVLTIHDVRFVKEARGIKRFILWLLWLKLPCRVATRITTISSFTKDELLSLCRVPEEKIVVIPDCVSEEFSEIPKSQPSAKPIILHVGTTENKNLDRLLDACESLDIELWILGKLSDGQITVLKERGLSYKEFFNLKREEVVRLYVECDIVSFVSLYEGFGLPILEGQAVGRPVLTSNIPPMTDVAANGALFVNPLDVHEIRNALRSLLTDPKLRADLVQKGLQNVARFTPSVVAEKYLRLYEDTLKRRK